MTSFKQKVLLSVILLGGSLYTGATGQAMAASGLNAPVVGSAAASTAIEAHYTYHGRSYAYRYHSKYFNHRSRKNGNWFYY